MENTLTTAGSSNALRMNRGMQFLAAFAFLALAATLVARLTGYTTGLPENSQLLESRSLIFDDVSKGVIQVFDANTRELILTAGPGEEVFLRTVMRGLAQRRQLVSSNTGAPFQLARFSDGRLVVHDEISGERIELNAFGPDNAAAFDRLLPDLALGSLTHSLSPTGQGGD
ncbi:MAG: photosynthetic complex assembly protein PuhC [Pseudomonadota bacterium]